MNYLVLKKKSRPQSFDFNRKGRRFFCWSDKKLGLILGYSERRIFGIRSYWVAIIMTIIAAMLIEKNFALNIPLNLE